MVKKFEIDENLIVMAAFTKIVKKFYKNLGANRSPEVIEKFKQAMINPAHFCRLDFDIDDIQRRYANLEIVSEFDPCAINADIIESDILDAYNELDEIYKNDTPAVNAGRFLDMVDDKALKYYKLGDFAPDRDNTYFLSVLEEKLTYYKPYDCNDDTDGTDKDNAIDVEKIVKQVKSEILSEIAKGIPDAFEKTMYTNLK